MKNVSSSRRFLLFWVLAFLSFPIAGLLPMFVVPVDTPLRALITGLCIGIAQGIIFQRDQLYPVVALADCLWGCNSAPVKAAASLGSTVKPVEPAKVVITAGA